MTVLKEVAAELIGMFVAEKQLTIAILGVVIVAGWLANFTDLDPLVGGTALLLGCLALLVESVFRGARTRGL
jgi:hypothetical protein